MPPKENRTWFAPIAIDTGSSPSPSSLMSSRTVFLGRIASTASWALSSASAAKEKPPVAPAYKKIEDVLCAHFGTRARVQHQKDGKGQIVLEYYSVEELNALLDKMKVHIS